MRFNNSFVAGLTVGGLIVNSALWFHAGYQCRPIVDKIKTDKSIPDDEKRKAIVAGCWKSVVGPALVTAGEAALLVKNHHDMTQQIGFATALASSRTAAEADLKRQMRKELGETAATRIENHALEEEIKKKGPPQDVQITGHGDTLVRNMIGGRDFYASYAHLLRSIEIASEMCRSNGNISVNIFYNILGIDQVDLGDLGGWDEEDLEDGLLPIKITSIIDEKYDAILAISTDKLRSFRY